MEEDSLDQQIKKLRKDRKQSQIEFAADLRVTQATVSGWEDGSVRPSSEALAKLGNLAAFPDNLWFWNESGMNQDALLSAAERTGKMRMKPPSPEENVRVPVAGKSKRKGKRTDISLPSELVPNPLSGALYEIDGECGYGTIAKGDVVILDTSTRSVQDLWGKAVLVNYSPPAPDRRSLHYELLNWRGGYAMGKLKYDLTRYGAPCVKLMAFADGQNSYAAIDGVIVGYWDPQDTPEDRQLLLPRQNSKEFEELAKSKLTLFAGLEILGRVKTWWRPDPER